jgi:hypothetical protein
MTNPKPNVEKPDYVIRPEERGPAERALARMTAKTAPKLKLLKNDLIKIDHPNSLVGELLVMEALGTGDQDFMEGIVRQLSNASGSPKQLADEPELNFMLSVVVGINPHDQVETMIAAQMAVIHSAAMKAAQRLARAEILLELESAERMLNKLVRSFTALTEALKRHRTVEEGTTVQNNVSVCEGGQAIVGHLTQHAPATPPEKSAVSPAAITDARALPMEIISKREQEAIPVKPKLNS